MEKKTYETPQLLHLGSVDELTAQPDLATNCSALEDAATVDEVCVIDR
jgi:hypothetical protein